MLPGGTTVVVAEPMTSASPPDRPSLPPGRWVRENLFPNKRNAALTVLAALLALFAYRGLLNFVFSEQRSWPAVRTNLRLLFTHAYPEEQYMRVWVSVGTVMVLAGLSIGIWARWGGVSIKRLTGWLMSAGAFIAAGILLREPSVLTHADGSFQRDAADDRLRESFAAAMADRGTWWLLAVVLIGAGLALWASRDDLARRTTFVPTTGLLFGLVGIIVGSTWVVRYGHYAFKEGEFIAEPGRTVALTTKLPWTVMWLLLVGCFAIGRIVRAQALANAPDDEDDPELPREALGRTRAAVNLAWLVSPFALYWVVLRDPDIDYAHVYSTILPMALSFAVLGSAVLWWLTRPNAGEVGRLAAIGLLLLAVFHWVAAFFGWYPMLQVGRIGFLLLAMAGLLAPNFAGVPAQRRRLVGAWTVTVALVFYGATVINAPSTISTPTGAIVGGFSATLFVAVLTIMLSFPLGVVLALARTSRQPIFRVLATSYIEIVRGIPLITVLIFFSIVLPLFLPPGMELGELAAAITGYTLFSAAYLAENVRGGLQSIRRGQYEAADAVGLTTTQRTGFIVLPQALRVSIPPLVGQIIATFKETSLLAIIGLFDFLRLANSVVPNQTQFLGVRREGLLFVSAVYWVVAFSMSKYSQRLERRVGLGQR